MYLHVMPRINIWIFLLSLCFTAAVTHGQDINECTDTPCHTNATCTNLAGSFTCVCHDGYTGDGVTCTDINECSDTPCHTNATCTNLAGSFTCVCHDGYTGDGVTCTDINECSDTPCHRNATCTNLVGSFTCVCHNGYTGDGVSCTDINECGSTDQCDSDYGVCINTEHGYTCACADSFELDSDKRTCIDINECSDMRCHRNATCTNLIGTFTCECRDGYTGDGISCTDELDCQYGLVCTHGMCRRNPINGLESCMCNHGYELSNFDNSLCIDIDECHTNPCTAKGESTCINTQGSFKCDCEEGYVFIDGYCLVLAQFRGSFTVVEVNRSSSLAEFTVDLQDPSSVLFGVYRQHFYNVINSMFLSESAIGNDYHNTKVIGFKPDNSLREPARTSVYYLVRLLGNTTQNNFRLLNNLQRAQDLHFRLYDQHGNSVTLQEGSASFKALADDCPTFCFNGAVCVLDGLYDETCICLTGFTGIQCESKESFNLRSLGILSIALGIVCFSLVAALVLVCCCSSVLWCPQQQERPEKGVKKDSFCVPASASRRSDRPGHKKDSAAKSRADIIRIPSVDTLSHNHKGGRSREMVEPSVCFMPQNTTQRFLQPDVNGEPLRRTKCVISHNRADNVVEPSEALEYEYDSDTFDRYSEAKSSVLFVDNDDDYRTRDIVGAMRHSSVLNNLIRIPDVITEQGYRSEFLRPYVATVDEGSTSTRSTFCSDEPIYTNQDMSVLSINQRNSKLLYY